LKSIISNVKYIISYFYVDLKTKLCNFQGISAVSGWIANTNFSFFMMHSIYSVLKG